MIGQDDTEVVSYLQKFGVDINPVRLGIDEKTFIVCFQNATSMRSNRYTYLHEIDLSKDRLKSVYKKIVKEF